jgi:hypothetical protein
MRPVVVKRYIFYERGSLCSIMWYTLFYPPLVSIFSFSRYQLLTKEINNWDTTLHGVTSTPPIRLHGVVLS